MAGINATDAYYNLCQNIQDNGGVFSDWYCGITNNVPRRVFEEHRLPENGLLFSCECASKDQAKAVENAFIKGNNCAGGGGGGNEGSVYVYVYKMTPDTINE